MTIGLVAGSGVNLEALLDTVEARHPFASFPHLNTGGVAGHASLFIQGRIHDTPVVLQAGRLHPYEGLSYEEVTRTVEIMHDFGVEAMLFTNAVGGLDPKMQPGDLVAADAIHAWPYRRYTFPERIRPDFVPTHCDHQGLYCWMHGPCYETRAEIRALQALGGATVGMSTAPELLRCQELGMRAGIISCVTNSCIRPQKLTHAHVLATAQKASERMRRVLRKTWPSLLGG